MDVRIIHFYPDLMSLYGSYANVLALKRYLERLDCDVTVESVLPGGGTDIAKGDFFCMGAGTERAARAAMEDFARYAQPLKAAAGDCAASSGSNTLSTSAPPSRKPIGMVKNCSVLRQA